MSGLATITRIIIVIASMVIFSDSAQSRFDQTKLGDWKFYAYTCKNALIGLSAIVPLEKKYDFDSIIKNSDLIKNLVVKGTLAETAYSFDQQDAEFTSDVVLAIYNGMHRSSIELNYQNIIKAGSNICFGIMDEFTNELKEPKK